MAVRVEVTYEMGKRLGSHCLELEAATVGDAIEEVRTRLGDEAPALTARTALALNGVLVRYRDRLRTRLSDGDTLSFVKAAAGG